MQSVPQVTFKIRERDDSIEGDNPFKWVDKTTADYFAGKKVILFSLPGAFTPTCSTYQLPDFNKLYDEFKSLGIDEIYCMSVNDSFVMNAWAKSQNIGKVKVIPDGNAEFTSSMGMLVEKENLCFGSRSWRYAAIIDNGMIIKMFEEDGKCDNHEEDPYVNSSPQNILQYLKDYPEIFKYSQILK